MNVEEILKRLKELQDPFDYQPDIDALVHDIEESLKRYRIKNGDEYWTFLGWDKNKAVASRYTFKGGMDMIEVFGRGNLEEVR